MKHLPIGLLYFSPSSKRTFNVIEFSIFLIKKGNISRLLLDNLENTNLVIPDEFCDNMDAGVMRLVGEFWAKMPRDNRLD